ncbi:MAG: type IV toxin-antitoxin system AbiEi family antitoxin domain-containing protein [Gemmatimonadota bacterium]
MTTGTRSSRRKPARRAPPGRAGYAQRVLELARRQGLLLASDVSRRGIPRTYLQRLVRAGLLVRSARGHYRASAADLSEHHSLAEAAARVPRGVVCLLSALRFHGLTTQNPVEIWMAVDHKAWRPRSGYPPLRLVFLSSRTLALGVETHRISGVSVRVYSAARTVADCFKFRHKLGIDVALEALRDYRRQHRGGMDALERYARVCRVARVMRPYLEATA